MLPGITPVLLPSAGLNVEVLMVAGGGGGGGRPQSGGTGTGAGGGGGGGVRHYASAPMALKAYNIVIGVGGGGATPGFGAFNGGDTTLTDFPAAIGGGRGGNYDTATSYNNATNGGCGGGAQGLYAKGTGIAGQGFDGGDGAAAGGPTYPGGGGGGAGGAGIGASGATPGNGGPGVSWSTSGAAVLYGAGGRGNSFNGAIGANGAGYGNYGSGGQAEGNGSSGSPGFNGIVIFQYAGTVIKASGGTITQVGGNTQHTFTANGTFTVTGAPIVLQTSRSLRFRGGQYFLRNYVGSPAFTDARVGTIRFSVKRGTPSDALAQVICAGFDGASANASWLYFEVDNSLVMQFGGGALYRTQTTSIFRDFAAWYDFVVTWDTRPATPVVTITCNGVAQPLSFNLPPQNATWQFCSSSQNGIGADYIGSNMYLNGLLAEFIYVDGQALPAAVFGQADPATGAWVPSKYTGTYGNRGFYLDFSDNSLVTSLGFDRSGNGLTWVQTGFSVALGVANDSLVDTPNTPNGYGTDTGLGGEVRSNYCVLNQISKNAHASVIIANMAAYGDGSSIHQIVRGTIPMTTGKWYWEVAGSGVGAGSTPIDIVGITDDPSFADGVIVGGSGNSCGRGYNTGTGMMFAAGTFTANGTVPPLENASMGFAYDADTGSLWLRNFAGTWVQGNPATGASPSFTSTVGNLTVFPAVSFYAATNTELFFFNFGQMPFVNPAPAGFKALCTRNLPAPAIAKPSSYFDIVPRNGTGAAGSVTTLGFQPDWLWTKSRSAGGYDNSLLDGARGFSKLVFSDLANAEDISNALAVLPLPNGYSFGSHIFINAAAQTYVDWLWKKGALPGLDIVTYTGNGSALVVPHALGAVPAMMVIKDRSAANDWWVYHKAIPNAANFYAVLNSTAIPVGPSGAPWGGNPPTAANFVVGAGAPVNAAGHNYVAYVFAEVPGFSKFGSYTANAVADGPFVYCGFRPKFVLFKSTNWAGLDWVIYDGVRSAVNPVQNYLFANKADAEGTLVAVDYLSTGFKVRVAGSSINNDAGGTVMFAAFAERPFKYARAR